MVILDTMDIKIAHILLIFGIFVNQRNEVNAIPALHPQRGAPIDAFSASIISSCPTADSNITLLFNKQPIVDACYKTDLSKLNFSEEIKAQNANDLVCGLFFNSFALFCETVKNNSLVLKNQTIVPKFISSNITLICENIAGNLVFKNNKPLCLRYCLDDHGVVLPQCALVDYYAKYKFNTLSNPQTGTADNPLPNQGGNTLPNNISQVGTKSENKENANTVQTDPKFNPSNQPAGSKTNSTIVLHSEGSEKTNQKPPNADGEPEMIDQEASAANKLSLGAAAANKQPLKATAANIQPVEAAVAANKQSVDAAAAIDGAADVDAAKQLDSEENKKPSQPLNTHVAAAVPNNDMDAKNQAKPNKGENQESSILKPGNEPDIEGSLNTDDHQGKNALPGEGNVNQNEQTMDDGDDESDLPNGDLEVDTNNFEVQTKAENVKPLNKPTKTQGDSDTVVSNNNLDDIDGESYFFSYFMVVCVLFVLGYVFYHNRTKVMALVLEGKRSKRQYRGRRPNSANYHKLDSNLEEAISSSCTKNSSNIIY